MRRTAVVLVCCCCFISVSSACSPVKSSGAQSPAPSSSPAKVFESRAAAERELRALYKSFLAKANSIYQSGGQGIERLSPFLTRRQWDAEKDSFEKFNAVGSRITGGAEVKEFILQSVDLDSGVARAYACVDVSGSRVLDASGEDVTPENRSDRGTVELSFVGLKLDKSEPWAGSSVC